MTEFIPPVRLDNGEVWDAVRPRLEELVRGGQFILGPQLAAFEEAAAEAFGCRWCVGTSSGTSALYLALRAAGLRPGSRVILPANTYYATFEAVIIAGLTPLLVDHDEDHLLSLYELDALQAEAVIPVHLYGLPVDMPALLRIADERGWWVLEDCSQAHGATVDGRPVGSLGKAGAFSAYPTKNLGAWGDAGFVTGSDPELESLVRRLRHHGQGEMNVHEDVANSDRLDTLQALVLTEKLKRLPVEVDRRRRVAAWYREFLADLEPELELELPGDRGTRRHVYHQFVIRVPGREAVRARMAELGVGTMVHYPTPIHQQPGAQGHIEVPRTPKRTEEWSSQILSLPMSPLLTRDEVERVVEALRKALREVASGHRT